MSNENDIAIVGMAAHLPGAGSIGEFWANLRDGVESIRRLSEAELVAAGETPDRLHHRDYVPAALQGTSNAKLLLGRYATHDDAVAIEHLAERRIVLGQLFPGENDVTAESDLTSDGACRTWVVPGDHRDTHARPSTCGNCLGGVGTRRVFQPHESEQFELVFGLACARGCGDVSRWSLRNGENTKSPACHAVGHSSPVARIVTG